MGVFFVVSCFSSCGSLCANTCGGPLNFFKKGDLLLSYLLPWQPELNPEFFSPSKPPRLPCWEMVFYEGNFTIFHPQLQELSSVGNSTKIFFQKTKKLQVLLKMLLLPHCEGKWLKRKVK